MNGINSHTRIAAQRVKLGQAPEAPMKTKPGKQPMVEVFEDLFEQVPKRDNDGTDENRELGKANFISRAPGGMNDWDFEFNDNSLARISDSSHDELIVTDGHLEFVSASDSGTVSRTVYDPHTDVSTVQTWTIADGASGTIALIPNELPTKSKWAGSPELVEQKKAMLQDMLSSLDDILD